MNWEAIGAIGEVLGAIAVIATLVYLGRQIKQSGLLIERANVHAQASTIHESNKLYAELFSTLAQDGELAAIYERALADQPLDPVERVRFTAWLNAFFAWLEDAEAQTGLELHFAGINGTADFWQVMDDYARRLLETEVGAAWWRDEAPHQFTPDFCRSVEQQVLGPSAAEAEN